VKITEKEVRYVADLANLRLTEAEVARFRADLDGILQHMDQLNEIDTTGVEPMAQVLFDSGQGATGQGATGQGTTEQGTTDRGTTDRGATLRADIPVPPLDNQLVLANAPQAGGGYFKVPKVIER
jgi:aspartyl-tRNA(Asn)/glutamyl-tRNA(Gln) amidotransferase subunit C